MRHLPLGYRIENGEAKIDERTADQVRNLFAFYNEGFSLRDAADKVGLTGFHSSIGRILKNEKYLGDDYYPALIDRETFEKTQMLRYEKAKSLGRLHDYSEVESSPKLGKVTFKLGAVPQKYDDPYEQAAFAYSLIETEEVDGE